MSVHFFSYNTEAEAKKECARLMYGLNQGTYIEPGRMTVAKYLDYWLENYAEVKTRKNTCDSYRLFIDYHIKPEIGNILLNKLQPLHIQQLLTKKSKFGRADGKPGGLSSRSVKYIYSVLHEALNHAVKWKLLSQNPAKAVAAPERIKKTTIVWTPEETRYFLTVAGVDRLYSLFVLALTTGMRSCELLALKWKDINFETGVIQVNYSLLKVRAQDPNKTKKNQRQVAVTQNVLDILKQHKIRQIEERMKVGQKYQKFDLVFCSRLGTPLNADNVVKRHFYPLIEKAKVRRVNFHSLRHCSAMMASAGGWLNS